MYPFQDCSAKKLFTYFASGGSVAQTSSPTGGAPPLSYLRPPPVEHDHEHHVNVSVNTSISPNPTTTGKTYARE